MVGLPSGTTRPRAVRQGSAQFLYSGGFAEMEFVQSYPNIVSRYGTNDGILSRM
jgi:hypothetical protein